MTLTPDLVIAYTLDGKRPGYQFVTGAAGVPEAVRHTVWRHAMPRGQGWGAEGLEGARALKTFPAGDGRMAISEVVVTGEADEMGRRGIRRAEVTLIGSDAYPAALDARYRALDPAARQWAVEQMLGFVWQRVWDRVLLRGGRQVTFSHPYAGPPGWQRVEALVLRLVTSPGVRLLEGWGPLVPFTTLALDAADGGRVVALPAGVAVRLPRRGVIRL